MSPGFTRSDPGIPRISTPDPLQKEWGLELNEERPRAVLDTPSEG